MNLVRSGARALARGARSGSSALAGLGAALLAVGLLRRQPKRELIFSKKLKKGEALRIQLVEPDE
jgi:hypothetical protein